MLRAAVLHRPARTNKSPYVCEILVDDTSDTALCHSPGLGCSGLVAPGRFIWVTPNLNPLCKTAYTAHSAECEDAEGPYRVCIHPLISQKAAASLLPLLGLPDGITWESEVFVDDHTRLDYVGAAPDGRKVYVEVKNAMISHETATKPRATRRAIFPEGFRKKKTDPVSPRAVKHALTLAQLATRSDTLAAILLFVIPRDDCGGGLEINPTDKVYSEAIAAALRAGVQTRVFSLRYADNNALVPYTETSLFVPAIKVRSERPKDRETLAHNVT